MSCLRIALAGLILTAGPAAADITPRQVWDGWLASLEKEGATVTTESVEDAGGRVVVTGLSMKSEAGQEQGYALEVDELTLSQNGDGSVAVDVSPEYVVVLSGLESGVDQEMHLLVQHPDLTMTVSDSEGVTRHTFSAPEIRLTLQQMVEDGQPVDAAGTLVVEDTKGHYDLAGTDGDAVGSSTLSAARLSLETSGTDGETGGAYKVGVTAQGFESQNVLEILGEDTATLARQLPPDTSLDGSFSTESVVFAIDSDEEGETSSISGTVGPGETRLGVSAKGFAYEGTSRDLALAVSGSALPLPQVNLSVGSTTIGLDMPLLAAEQPQPYSLGVSLVDVALDEGLWSMFDPAGILPRDPGEVTLQVSGEIAVDQDVDTMDVADDARDELRSLDIDAARLAFAGAEAGATGNLTVTPSPAGAPQLIGEIAVKLIGASELLDKLVQAGLVPEEQAMGARMMLGMFARPGEAPNEMVSSIRLSEDGGIFVNDQQVR